MANVLNWLRLHAMSEDRYASTSVLHIYGRRKKELDAPATRADFAKLFSALAEEQEAAHERLAIRG